MNKKAGSFCLPIVLASVLWLGACTSLPSMNDPKSYASMNCQQLTQERAAVEANRSYHEDNSGFGFFDLLGAVTEGLAMGQGNTALASQQHATNAQMQKSHDDSRASADAYANREALLDRVSAVRKCA